MSGKPTGEWNRKKILRTALGLLLFWTISAAILFVPLAGWTSADVTTGQHAGYPDLQPRVYDMSRENTIQFAQAAIARQTGWKVVKTDTGQGILEATAPGFPSPSDITITVTPEAQTSSVTIRSRSRFGFADLGANARHIRALQAAMDDKLPRLK
jgi:uncharacterized protein (DUF1499 family)